MLGFSTSDKTRSIVSAVESFVITLNVIVSPASSVNEYGN
jgi:hypothetical protein